MLRLVAERCVACSYIVPACGEEVLLVAIRSWMCCVQVLTPLQGAQVVVWLYPW